MSKNKKFQFNVESNSTAPEMKFFGYEFYDVYRNAHFLKNKENVQTILGKAYQLRTMLKDVAPGESVEISDMYLYNGEPLRVTKSGPLIKIRNHEFTLNRLTGLTAAYAFVNRKRFPDIHASEALSLGLRWDDAEDTARLYLAAVSGAEHFYEQFSYWPLVCALKKLELKKITLDPVVKIAQIKNTDGIKMGTDMLNHFKSARQLWSMFTHKTDFKNMLKYLPQQLKKVLRNTTN